MFRVRFEKFLEVWFEAGWLMGGVSTTGGRGYGRVHVLARRAWQLELERGAVVRCARGAECKQAVLLGGVVHAHEPWDLGHVDDDRTQYSGVEHAGCNRATAGRQRARVSRQW